MGEEYLRPRKEGVLKVYTYYVYTLSKEAEMMLIRILVAVMIFLFLRFLIEKARGIKAAGYFNKFFVVICSLFGFHRQIISTLRSIRVYDYLFLSNLQKRFILLSCRSIPMIKYRRKIE